MGARSEILTKKDDGIKQFSNWLINRKISRRDLIKYGILGLTLPVAGSQALSIPDRQLPEEKEEGIFPGWIESEIRTNNFINYKNGHFDWLKDAVNSDPLLLHLTRDYFTFLVEKQKEGKRLELSEALMHPIRQANEIFTKAQGSVRIDPRTNTTLEAIHAGLFVFAAGFNNWWSENELKNFGVPIEKYKGVNDFFWGRDGIGTAVYPMLFTANGRRDIDGNSAEFGYRYISGQDRSVHFAQHALLAFEYLYSKNFDLNEHKSIPNFLRAYINLSSRDSEDQAKTFSDAVGKLYEFSGLKDLNSWPLPGKDPAEINEGIFDPEVGNDILANKLGAKTGVELFKMALTGQKIDGSFENAVKNFIALKQTKLSLPRF